jgi:hypothetical protein
MAFQASDDDIAMFAGFTSCDDRIIASRFILVLSAPLMLKELCLTMLSQGASGNVQAAINNFFDNPNKYDAVSN